MILKRINVERVTTDKDEIERLIAEGFVPIFVEPEEVEKPDTRPLAELTVKELRKIAGKKGLKLSKALRKQDLIDILEEAND